MLFLCMQFNWSWVICALWSNLDWPNRRKQKQLYLVEWRSSSRYRSKFLGSWWTYISARLLFRFIQANSTLCVCYYMHKWALRSLWKAYPNLIKFCNSTLKIPVISAIKEIFIELIACLIFKLLKWTSTMTFMIVSKHQEKWKNQLYQIWASFVLPFSRYLVQNLKIFTGISVDR